MASIRVRLAPVPPPAGSPLPREHTCIVIDILRATSCMAVMLGRGVTAVYPAPGVEEARVLRDTLRAEGETPLLAGEVHALPPEGFDLGNSPSDFQRMALPPSVVVSTTNGTPALLACVDSPLVMPGAPLNAGAVTAAAMRAGRDVLLVCAGLRGEPAQDDLLAAGLLADRLEAAGATVEGHEAATALETYRRARSDLYGALRATEHGRRLIEIGFDHDIALCASVDTYESVGALSVDGTGRAIIRLMP